MNLRHVFFLFLFSFFITFLCAQNKVTVHGVTYDVQNNPVDNVMVLSSQIENTAISSETGKYQIMIPANVEIKLHFRHIAYRDTVIIVKGKPNEQIQLNVALVSIGSQLQGVDISTTHNDGYMRVDPKLTFKMPSPTGGAESLIKMLPGVSSVNELSSQYNVRGGNYDENMIFVNDIAIYRPFLVRSGNQEGLSFVNLDLTQNVKFSAGGFPAQYGDKMSSAMDVEYKKPKQLGGSFMISFLGTSAHIEGVAKNKQKTRNIFTYLLGVRYKTNAYLLNSMDTKGDYKPNFFDTQILLDWNITDKFEIGLLGNFSINKYIFAPTDRKTIYGGLNPLQVNSYFDGQEVDKYENYLGGLTFTYRPNLKNKLRLILSSYYAKESETFDIQAQYYLKELEIDMGTLTAEEISTLAIGTNIDHARNHIKFLVSAADIRGDHQLHKRNNLSWSVKVQHEQIQDKIYQWHLNDSTGYTLPHLGILPSDSIGVSFGDTSRILTLGAFNFYDASHYLPTVRITAFVQDTWKLDNDINPRFTLNAGVRFHYWSYNNEPTFSPRLSLLYKPRWEKDWSFWFKTGVYYQAPFYRELRNREGELNPNIKSQFSYQAILASEYNFKLWRRPFKLTMEGYYKYMNNLISYYLDNIQIVYSGVNDAKGFATGFDTRFSGELIEGLESWISLSLMRTMDKENPHFNEAGEWVAPTYKKRPTDQLFALNVFFQDHLPGFRQVRVSLNFVYSTGLPSWIPNAMRTKDNIKYMRDYFRVDAGFSYIFFEQSRDRFKHKSKFVRAIKNAGVYFEVFNLLNRKNESSYMWIKTIKNDYCAVPNFLTPRLINLKLAVEF